MQWLDKELQAEIDKIEGLSLTLNAELSQFMSLKLTGLGHIIEIQTESALKEVVTLLRRKQVDYGIVGWGANQILREGRVYLKLDLEGNYQGLKEIQEEYKIPASYSLNKMTAFAIKMGLKGWEVFTGVPASLGGAVAMNAGTRYGEIGELVKYVRYLSLEGRYIDRQVSASDFKYRGNLFLKPGEIITEVTLIDRGQDMVVAENIKSYLKKRVEEQPLNAYTCGCVFKNLEVGSTKFLAGKTVDELGLKGFRYKNLRVSPMHGNFIENLGGASVQEFLELIDLLKKYIWKRKGIEFELEVKL